MRHELCAACPGSLPAPSRARDTGANRGSISTPDPRPHADFGGRWFRPLAINGNRHRGIAAQRCGFSPPSGALPFHNETRETFCSLGGGPHPNKPMTRQPINLTSQHTNDQTSKKPNQYLHPSPNTPIPRRALLPFLSPLSSLTLLYSATSPHRPISAYLPASPAPSLTVSP
jgi:hypothetical protein